MVPKSPTRTPSPLHIAFITTCRSDWGAMLSVVRGIGAAAELRLSVVAGGAHLSAAHGHTVDEVIADGVTPAWRLPFADDDDPARVAERALRETAKMLGALRPDLVLLYGDRLELLPIANACLVALTPIAHVCGGDITEGALDEQVRHALTKLAHLHFPSSERSAERVRQMGEEPWRVHAVGDPSLDRMRTERGAELDELERTLGFRPDRTTLLVTLHPTTHEPERVAAEVEALATVLVEHDGWVLLTAPAPDPGAPIIRARWERLVAERPRTLFVESLGQHRYRGMLRSVGAMVGNSSSGLSEAPVVELPAVNIGARQAGRDRAGNVLDCEGDPEAIRAALARALDPAFRASLAGSTSPYGDGRATERIVAALRALPPREQLLRKRFVEPARPTSAAIGGPRAIGGDFDADWSSLSTDAEPGWFATGRDAFAALARTARGRWLLPAYLCPVVAEALRAVGATPVPYRCVDPWTPDLDALAPLLDGAAAIVVNHYIGLEPAAELWAALAARNDLLTVEDRCQSVGRFVDEPLRGHAAVWSLRKWLPLPDGALLRARPTHAPPPAESPPPRAMVRLRAAAALLKRAALDEPALAPALEATWVRLFRDGEGAAADGAPGDRGATRQARAVTEAADLDAIVARRLRNQRQLVKRLAAEAPGLIWEPSPGALLACDRALLAVPIRVEVARSDELRGALSRARIFCAAHWRDGDWATVGGDPAAWAAGTLSLPIDQRLDEADLDRLAATLVELLR